MPMSIKPVSIIHNRVMGGWYIVRGFHQTPISGRFVTREAAQAYLKRAEGQQIESLSHCPA